MQKCRFEPSQTRKNVNICSNYYVLILCYAHCCRTHTHNSSISLSHFYFRFDIKYVCPFSRASLSFFLSSFHQFLYTVIERCLTQFSYTQIHFQIYETIGPTILLHPTEFYANFEVLCENKTTFRIVVTIPINSTV